jgi:hypothetical protein
VTPLTAPHGISHHEALDALTDDWRFGGDGPDG